MKVRITRNMRWQGQQRTAGDTVEVDDLTAARWTANGLAAAPAKKPTKRAVADALPEDFPGRSFLMNAGVTTLAAVRAMGDLTSITGIGDATARDIADALGTY